MKRFRFPLRPVAVLRAHREQLAREAFATAVRAAAQAEAELSTIRTRIAEFEAALAAGRKATFTAMDQVHALAAYRAERELETAAERAVQAAHAVTQQRRLDYVEAHRRVEIVKRLEEKARAEHRLDMSREEQANFDDFAGRSFAAKARSAA